MQDFIWLVQLPIQCRLHENKTENEHACVHFICASTQVLFQMLVAMTAMLYTELYHGQSMIAKNKIGRETG